MDRRARSALYDGDTRARAFGVNRAHGAAVASVFLLIFVFRALVLIILVLPVKFLIIVLVTSLSSSWRVFFAGTDSAALPCTSP
jgi:hypothetical protein